MSDDKGKVKTVYKALGLGGYTMGGNPAEVDVKDGRIIRVRPFHFNWKYDKKTNEFTLSNT